ncbi:DUF433 domain-containing protein [Flavobacterium solisilvae]|uniref:DUF433 domain-containing protein n=1 Tax=Flavobacterium solisilvae TaxID=1852019 RepID=A0ABX1QQD2_9FLAO|nr:DUF433 domain-containing protein [Flavobacterium solisilvae]NMH24410.1 DUF433 domain-containing protein [Flavobacterium solisilvae]
MENTVLDRITILPDLCNGKPTIRGLRITVETILQFLSEGDSAEDILEAYPFLEKEDIQAAVAFALKNLSLQRNDIQLAS